jgi:hypothetical protein
MLSVVVEQPNQMAVRERPKVSASRKRPGKGHGNDR